MRRIAFGVACATLVASVVVGVASLAGGRPGQKGFARVASTRGAMLNNGGPVRLARGAETVIDTYTIEAGGSSGWHTHPGAAIFVVAEGTLVTYGVGEDPCKGEVVKTGEAYVVPAAHAGHPHLVHNEGTAPVRVLVSYPDIPAGAPVAKDATPPRQCAGLS